MQQAQAGREIRLAYQEAVKEDGRVLGDEAARQLKEDLQTLGVERETARTVLQGMDMPNAWASDGLRAAMESVYETARSEAAKVEARAARTEAAELKSSQRLGALMEKFTAAQAQANAARGQNDLKGYLAAVEDMRGAVSNYQNALAVEEKAGEARQIETQEQTRKSTAATEKAVAAAQPAVQEGYARVAAKIANERAATAEQFGAQQAAGQAQNAAGQAEAGQMAAGTFAPDPALPNSGFPVSIAQYDDDTKRQIVRAFAAYEMSGVDTADRIVLGVVPEQLATDVERIAQIDIHGFDNVLQADGLRHGAKHDGRTGNKPVTPEDVAALLDIFDTYNNITVTSKRGETSIKLSKTGADGMTYVAVIGKKKGHIFTKNMWKGQTKGDGSFRRTDAHNAPASTPAAAANYEPSTDSLPENVQDGKGTTGFLPSTADATGRPQAQAREPMRANRADAAATPQGTAGVDVMDELVRGAGMAVSAQETEGTGARARSAMEAAMDGTEEPGARPAGQGKRRYRAGVNRADTAVRLDAADRMQLRVLDGLGKKYGVKIVIEDSIRYEDGEGRVYAGTSNGYYDRSDGTIHVALDAEGGAYLFFAVHELTHKLRAENADAYAALEAFVLNKLEASELYGALTQGEGGTLEERIASVQALYAARGQELSRGEALEELVCDAIPVILTDEQAVRELVRTDRTLAERIRDFFEEFYHELTRQLAGVVYGPGNRAEAAALMNDAETVRELAELFRMALESSADLQYELLTQSGSAIEEAGTGAKDRRFSIVTLQNGSTFVKADGDKVIRGSDPNAWASQVENYILSIVNDRGRLDIPTADGSVLTITGYGTRESHTTAGELSNFNDYYDENGLFDEESARVRAQASLYIDEVVKISRDEGKRAVADRRAEHGEIAVNGWKYRNVHFMDTDGTYYQITLGVPQGVAGRQTAYGLGNVRKRKSPIDLGSSLSGAPKDGTPSVDSIRSAMGKSNTLDEKSGGNLHDESLNTKDVPKFSMRTDEGEDGRAAYVSDGTDAGRGRRLSARADGEETITMEDVAAIQSIGRKSVNAFSSDEIRTAEPFARRYWRELGVKSPFFRAWFGDWRANDNTKVDMATERGDARGRTRNVDTGWDINVSGKVFNETRAHTGPANIYARDYIPYINDIIGCFAGQLWRRSRQSKIRELSAHAQYVCRCGYWERPRAH